MKTEPREVVGICGLFCETCPSFADGICRGCLSDVVAEHCAVCRPGFRTCAEEHHVTWCNECEDFPCDRLREFKDVHIVNGISHHEDILNYVRRQREIGVEAWVKEQEALNTCPVCGNYAVWCEKLCRYCGAPRVNIIKAEEDQYDEVRGFYHSLIDAMSGGTVYVGWQKDVYPAPEFLADSIRKGEMYLVLEGEQIAGAMVYNHDYNEGYTGFQWQTEAEDSEVMVIHALGVHPDFAGKGHAKRLVQKAIDLARENGMKAIRLDVLEGNTPAENLYTGFGFKYMSTLQMYYEDTGWTNFRLYEYVV